jgi:hypothetical protein
MVDHAASLASPSARAASWRAVPNPSASGRSIFPQCFAWFALWVAKAIGGSDEQEEQKSSAGLRLDSIMVLPSNTPELKMHAPARTCCDELQTSCRLTKT